MTAVIQQHETQEIRGEMKRGAVHKRGRILQWGRSPWQKREGGKAYFCRASNNLSWHPGAM